MIEQYPIDETGGIPAFEQIVFGMITVFGRGNKVFFNFKNRADKFVYEGNTSTELMRFLKKEPVRRVRALSGPAAQMESQLTPLDLHVERPSAIVLAFPFDSNLQFATSVAAVTKKVKSDTGYSNLRYVSYADDGTPTLSEAPVERCQTVMFFATKPAPNFAHGFNFHIDIVQQSPNGRLQLLPLLIDPMIRNP